MKLRFGEHVLFAITEVDKDARIQKYYNLKVLFQTQKNSANPRLLYAYMAEISTDTAEFMPEI